jgi:hypothetical protein
MKLTKILQTALLGASIAYVACGDEPTETTSGNGEISWECTPTDPMGAPYCHESWECSAPQRTLELQCEYEPENNQSRCDCYEGEVQIGPGFVYRERSGDCNIDPIPLQGINGLCGWELTNM